MNEALTSDSTEARRALASLFETAPPVLIELRFPGAATSPDWHLSEAIEQLEPRLEHLVPGVELYLSSVWDLKNTKGAIRLRK